MRVVNKLQLSGNLKCESLDENIQVFDELLLSAIEQFVFPNFCWSFERY